MVASSSTSGTWFSTIMRARPSAIAVLPTPASPTYSGLFLRRRQRISMVRSTSSLRPISGIDLALARRLVEIGRVFLERIAAALAIALGIAAASRSSSRSLRSSPPALDSPWAMKLTTSRRDTSCMLSRYAACDCFSLKIATSTLATVTSFLPLDCTWNTARCSTRWNPSVGCTSRSSPGGSRGVGLIDELLELGLELGGVGAAGLEDLPHLRRVHDGEQQMLDRHEFMSCLACTRQTHRSNRIRVLD